MRAWCFLTGRWREDSYEWIKAHAQLYTKDILVYSLWKLSAGPLLSLHDSNRPLMNRVNILKGSPPISTSFMRLFQVYS